MFMKIKITTEKIIKLIMVENDQKKIIKKYNIKICRTFTDKVSLAV